jgi:exodeoxyribonuclease VII large subunit
MEQGALYPALSVLRLSELNSLVRKTIESSFPETLWVVAEISEIRANAGRHCYLELVEREDDRTVAQIRATIWAYTFRTISQKFERATGDHLNRGMKVLLQVRVSFHEIYGLSLNVTDIDPAYSLGEMARRKREVIERLRKEGLQDLNKRLPLPLVPQRIAVISSAGAAGYGDFFDHLEKNPRRYRVYHSLYQTLMQGQGAEASIISSLTSVKRHREQFDAVVVIRGGGSQIDLSCFDAYSIASEVARFPLPVITGIGHERDDTVVDIVAHTRLKTPTAVAEFLLNGMSGFEERVASCERRIGLRVRTVLKEEGHRLEIASHRFVHSARGRLNGETALIGKSVHRLIHGSTRSIDVNRSGIDLAHSGLHSVLKVRFQRDGDRLAHFERALRLLDPLNVLKRGYSITYLKGKVVKENGSLNEGDIIETMLYQGKITSRVEGRSGKE